MPTDWADKVRAAITNLETKTDRVLEPDQALALIDYVVEGKFAAGDLATIHGTPQESIRTTLGQITRAVGSGRVRSLATAVGMNARAMTSRTTWPPVSPPPGRRRAACNERTAHAVLPHHRRPRSRVLLRRRANDR